MAKKSKKEIRVCPECSVPVVFTFAFDYREYFCVNCHKGGDMFWGRHVEQTPRLELAQQIVKAVWKVVYGKSWFLPKGSFTMSKCKKCTGGAKHREHLSKREEERDKSGRRALLKLKRKLTKLL